jgi:hypothetical protein
VIAEYGHVLPPPELGLLEAVAIDAILGALEQMANSGSPGEAAATDTREKSTNGGDR